MLPIHVNIIGRIISDLRSTAGAPKQGDEGAPDAWLEVLPEYVEGLAGIGPGDSLTVLTWLHEARRDVLTVNPRGNPNLSMRGVFATRSPHRPNPIGLHRVRVLTIQHNRIKIGSVEAIDGTPVVDIKLLLPTDG